VLKEREQERRGRKNQRINKEGAKKERTIADQAPVVKCSAF